MATPMDIARLLVRQAEEGADDEPSPGHCVSSNDYDGRMGIRISAVFVILIGSMLGESNNLHRYTNVHTDLYRCCIPRLRKETSRIGSS